jgi:hypothetical protein
MSPSETFFHIAKMDIEIAATRWPPGLGHVLSKDFSRTNSFHKHSSEITNQRRYKVARFKRIGAAHGRSLLAQRSKHATYDFSLAIEVYETLFNKPGQFQIAVELQLLFRVKSGFVRTSQRFAILRLARRVLCADAHLMSRRPPAFSARIPVRSF